MKRKFWSIALAGAVAGTLTVGSGSGVTRALAHSEHEGHGEHAGHAGHSSPTFAAGEPGTGEAVSRTVEIRITDAEGKMAFQPASLEIARGEQVKFVLSNAGAVDHEFLIDTVTNNAAHKEAMAADPEMQHAEPNGRRLKPGEKAELVWRFTKPGSFEMACLIPGHYESGMKGLIVVK